LERLRNPRFCVVRETTVGVLYAKDH